MKRKAWLSGWKYKKLYPDEFIDYPKPDYRKEKETCMWCGGRLKNKRQWHFCSQDCAILFHSIVTWGMGIPFLPYRIACRDNFTCQECGLFLAYKNEHGMFIPAGVNMEIHHIIPVSKGGSDNQANLKTLCIDCHKIQHRNEVEK